MIYLTCDTPIGTLGIVEGEGAITHVLFACDAAPQGAQAGETPLLREAAAQLRAYLDGRLRAFTLPLAPRGTPFMQAAWRELARIPYGTTATYGQLASRLGNAKAARAVGLANNRNPIPLILPCHRVVGSDGKLTGFRGGLPMKAWLLEMEAAHAGL